MCDAAVVVVRIRKSRCRRLRGLRLERDAACWYIVTDCVVSIPWTVWVLWLYNSLCVFETWCEFMWLKLCIADEFLAVHSPLYVLFCRFIYSVDFRLGFVGRCRKNCILDWDETKERWWTCSGLVTACILDWDDNFWITTIWTWTKRKWRLKLIIKSLVKKRIL